MTRLPSRHENPVGLNVVHEPERTPSVDIIFVHGLGGTSRHTWSKDKDAGRFWPEQWLPTEPDICTARVLSFGYNAAATPTAPGSVLNITDFAKNLLFCMRYGKDEATEELNIGRVRRERAREITSRNIAAADIRQVPIIFVVHSMGGLVVKKASPSSADRANNNDHVGLFIRPE